MIAYLFNLRGNAHYMAKRYHDAIANYTEAISNQSNNEVLNANRGNAYSKLSDYALAASDYSEAIKLQPSGNGYRYYRRRGDTYRQIGDNKNALADYETFVALTDDQEAKAVVQQIIAGLK